MSVIRVDPTPIMTVSDQYSLGGERTIFVVPGCTVALYTDTAGTILATTYTDATGSTPCPITAQITLPGSSLPTSTTGPQGQFGFWLNAGTYYYRVTTPSGQVSGLYPLTAGVPGPGFYGPGYVSMQHNGLSWFVLKPDGTLLNTAGSATSGMQEAINYAVANCYNLRVEGGWSEFVIAPTITITGTTLSFPAMNNMDIRMRGLVVSFINMGALDAVTFDSWDRVWFDFGNSQFVYDGTASHFHFHPLTPIGPGGFIGQTSSYIWLPEIAQGASAGKPQQGAGVRFTIPYISNPGGGNIVASNEFHVGEISSGNYGLIVDDPGPGSGGFVSNTVYMHSVRNQAIAGLQVGTSAASFDGSFNANTWIGNFSQGGTATVRTWGGSSYAGGDTFDITGGGAPFVLESTATGNVINTPQTAAALPVINNSTARTNRLHRSGPAARTAITLSSTVAYVPSLLQQSIVTLSGGTVTKIEVAQDGANFDDTGATFGSFALAPGAAIKATFSVSPTVQTQVLY